MTAQVRNCADGRVGRICVISTCSSQLETNVALHRVPKSVLMLGSHSPKHLNEARRGSFWADASAFVRLRVLSYIRISVPARILRHRVMNTLESFCSHQPMLGLRATLKPEAARAMGCGLMMYHIIISSPR
jgi:uracil-DNA glycosylase